MIIELKDINVGESIDIVDNIDINKTNEDIKKLNNISVDLNIFKESNNSVLLSGKIHGEMILEDSISLEEVNYPFNIELENELMEFDEFGEKSLDIIQVLWENILLEVPLKVTSVTDVTIYGFINKFTKNTGQDN
ncbi:MAG: hypothetical protein RSF67_07155 [Clostridia bacterium]